MKTTQWIIERKKCGEWEVDVAWEKDAGATDEEYANFMKDRIDFLRINYPRQKFRRIKREVEIKVTDTIFE